MTGYLSVREAAAQWEISERQVQKLCGSGRIQGVIRFSNAQAIPDAAPKPTRTAKSKPRPRAKDTHSEEQRMQISDETLVVNACR